MTIESINPATGQKIKDYQEFTPEEAECCIMEGHKAFLSWRNTRLADRTALMSRAADMLADRKEDYAHLMAVEMGKPLEQGLAEIEKCAWVCRYYAENGEGFLQPEEVETDAGRSFITFQPLGVVLAVMPWNFPFWQVFRFVAPNLIAGNVGLLKHASNVPGCALAIEDVLLSAGFPKHVLQTLLVGSDQVEAVIADRRVRAVTLTGSTPAGRSVARAAGEHLKKTVLELGGSDPYLILEDADVDAAVETCVKSRLINSGQSCIAAKRFIVVERHRAEVEKRFIELMSSVKMGDPTDKDTEVGPQARTDLRDELHQQVEDSISKGAKLLLGGEIPDGDGAFYPPTVLADVRPGMPAYDEELFGPVAAIIGVADEAEALRVANDSSFGLGAAVFTEDRERGTRIAAQELEAGCCFVNELVRSDPRLPFGGVKESGYGRELSPYGIKEFVNIKTVYVA